MPRSINIVAFFLVAWLAGGISAASLASVNSPNTEFSPQSESIDHLRSRAEAGDQDAQTSLGFIYGGSYGVLRNDVEAVKWFQKAADQGSARAQHDLANMYANGQGVPQDYSEAAKWYQLSASQGFAPAQNNLANLYASGKGVPQDYAEAAKWYLKAANQGVVAAQVILANMYHGGQGVPHNDSEAVSWYLKAAKTGDAVAQSNLGAMYANGQGIPQDNAEAAKWFRKAAKQGDTVAKSNLALISNKNVFQKKEAPENISQMSGLGVDAAGQADDQSVINNLIFCMASKAGESSYSSSDNEKSAERLKLKCPAESTIWINRCIGKGGTQEACNQIVLDNAEKQIVFRERMRIFDACRKTEASDDNCRNKPSP